MVCRSLSITVAWLRRAWLIPWCQLRISGHVDDATALLPRHEASGFNVSHDDAVDSGPCTQ